MSAIALAKLARLQERIRVTIRGVPLPRGSISIVVKDLVSGLRADLGRANAEREISILLEQKAALEGRIALYAQPVSTAKERRKERRESAGSGCSGR